MVNDPAARKRIAISVALLALWIVMLLAARSTWRRSSWACSWPR